MIDPFGSHLHNCSGTTEVHFQTPSAKERNLRMTGKPEIGDIFLF
jgi:hypothetical protein